MLIDLQGLHLRDRRFPNQLLRFRVNIQIFSRLGRRRKYDHSHAPECLLRSRRQKIILRRSRERSIMFLFSARLGMRRRREPQSGRRYP